MSSADALNLVTSKNLSFGKGVNYVMGASAPIYVFPGLSVISTHIYILSEPLGALLELLSETMVGCERGMNPFAVTIINFQKDVGQTRD